MIMDEETEAKVAPAKKVWQMTRAEFLRGFLDDLEGNTGQFIKTRMKHNELLLEGKGKTARGIIERHKQIVKDALKSGKPVPAKVLADF